MGHNENVKFRAWRILHDWWIFGFLCFEFFGYFGVLVFGAIGNCRIAFRHVV
jgi:hypothetical protein